MFLEKFPNQARSLHSWSVVDRLWLLKTLVLSKDSAQLAKIFQVITSKFKPSSISFCDLCMLTFSSMIKFHLVEKLLKKRNTVHFFRAVEWASDTELWGATRTGISKVLFPLGSWLVNFSVCVFLAHPFVGWLSEWLTFWETGIPREKHGNNNSTRIELDVPTARTAVLGIQKARKSILLAFIRVGLRWKKYPIYTRWEAPTN